MGVVAIGRHCFLVFRAQPNLRSEGLRRLRNLTRAFEADLKGWMTTIVARRFCAEFGLAINCIPQYLPEEPKEEEGIGAVFDEIYAGIAGRGEKIDELAIKSGQMRDQSSLMAQNSQRLKSAP